MGPLCVGKGLSEPVFGLIAAKKRLIGSHMVSFTTDFVGIVAEACGAVSARGSGLQLTPALRQRQGLSGAHRMRYETAASANPLRKSRW